MSRTLTSFVSPTLLALMPRQVLLSHHNMKQRDDRETPKSSAVLNPNTGSANERLALEPEQRTLLLHAVALYLERSGFSKTLKKFRSEAQIEKDSSKDFLLNLEEMCHKYLKKCSQGITTQNKQVNVETVKEVVDDRVPEAQEEPKKKDKDKKRTKKNMVTEAHVDTVEKEKSESLHVESLKNSKGTVPSEGNTVHEEAGKKSKDKKKKKNKEKLESVAKNSDDANVSRDSKAEDSIALNGNVVTLEEKVVKSKTKKKKDGHGQHLSDENSNQLVTGLDGTVNKIGGIKTLHEDENNENSKKRKRFASENHDSHTVDEKESEDVKRRKLVSSKGSNDGVQSTKVNASVEADVNAGSRDTSNEHYQQTDDVEKTGERSSTKKAMRKHSNGSTEPKTITAFQRVKVDAVEFADEKLTDNSYWAKGGAETGYGAKAQEILGQVKGRGFRHEKTKKKRGSYRGGVIDLQSHSVKFNYSDDD